MPEGLSAAEVGKEIAEHREHTEHAGHGAPPGSHEHARRDRAISIVEALLLSIVALMAAWSGYSAAKWGSRSTFYVAKSSVARSNASVNEIQATQIRTLDSVSFNSAEAAYLTGNAKLFDLAIRRMRPGYRVAVEAWLALHPLKNPAAPPDPSYMPQYRIPQQAAAQVFTTQANADFTAGQSASDTADKYVRLTVLLAAVLFLVGIGSRFPARVARYGLIGIAAVLLIVSVVQLLSLPGPPS
jgi:hypothetical protein